MGLANRLSPDGRGAGRGAVALARQLAAFPQRCMRSDRALSYEQWDLAARRRVGQRDRARSRRRPQRRDRRGRDRGFASGAGRHGGGV